MEILPDRTVYLVAAAAAVADLKSTMLPEFIASRTWFIAAIDAAEVFRRPLPPPKPDHTQVLPVSPHHCPLCADDSVGVTAMSSEMCTSDGNRRRHLSADLRPHQMGTGRVGITQCGLFAHDEEFANFYSKRWGNGTSVAIAGLPMCRRCDRSAAAS